MTRHQHQYRPMSAAPKDGTPIIAVCGGVECGIMWDDPAPLDAGWYHFDEDEGGNTYERVRQAPTGWRPMFAGGGVA